VITAGDAVNSKHCSLILFTAIQNTGETSMFLVFAVEVNQDLVTNKLTASRQCRRYSNQQSATQAHAGHPNPSSTTQAHTGHSKPAVLKLLLLTAVFLVAKNCGMLGMYTGNTGGELDTCTYEGSVLQILYLLLTG
jgi:hypothetical protein